MVDEMALFGMGKKAGYDAGYRAGIEAMRDGFISDMARASKYEPGQSIGADIVKGKLAEAGAWSVPIAQETATRLLNEIRRTP